MSSEQLKQTIQQVRTDQAKRGFNQSVELVLTLHDIDVKKQELNINEVVYLPHKFSEQASVCVFASGDLAVRAKKAGTDRVIEPDELDTVAASKRELKKIARTYSFFLAEPTLMPKIGRIFGQYLGPRGKMPSPVATSAPIDAIVGRLRSAIRVKGRGQMSIACKVGEEGMTDEMIAENALSTITAIEKKLPSGSKNINRAIIKLTMGQPRVIRLEGR